MPHLTFAELINRRVPVSTSEAAALTLAVARELAEERAVGRPAQLPDDGWIILSSTGHVSLLDVDGSTAGNETAGLALLLRRLLRIEERGPASRRESIPGGLLVLLARNLGQIDLPPSSGDEFRAALERFATVDATLLAAVFWRAARFTPDVVQSRAAVFLPSAPRQREDDRRQRGPSRAELRRALREVERQLFEMQQAEQPARAAADASPRGRRWIPVASAVNMSFAGILLVAALGVSAAVGVRSATTATAAATPLAQTSKLAQTSTGGELAVEQRSEPTTPDRANSVDQGIPTRVAPVKTRAAVRARVRDDTRSRAARPNAHASPSRPRRATPVANFPGGTRTFPFAVPAG